MSKDKILLYVQCAQLINCIKWAHTVHLSTTRTEIPYSWKQWPVYLRQCNTPENFLLYIKLFFSHHIFIFIYYSHLLNYYLISSLLDSLCLTSFTAEWRQEAVLSVYTGVTSVFGAGNKWSVLRDDHHMKTVKFLYCGGHPPVMTVAAGSVSWLSVAVAVSRYTDTSSHELRDTQYNKRMSKSPSFWHGQLRTLQIKKISTSMLLTYI